MNRILFPVLIVASIFFTSCASRGQRLTNDVNRLTATVERTGGNMTEAQANKFLSDYQSLIYQIENYYTQMSPAEKQNVLNALGRCHGAMAKAFINQANTLVDQIGEQGSQTLDAVPSYLEGFEDGFGGFDDNASLQELENTLDESAKKLEESAENLETYLESNYGSDDDDSGEY